MMKLGFLLTQRTSKNVKHTNGVIDVYKNKECLSIPKHWKLIFLTCSVLDKDRKTTYEKWVFYCFVRSLSVSLLTSQQETL